MSTTYPSLTETRFPDQIDVMQRMRDVSNSDLVNLSTYRTYVANGNMEAAAAMVANDESFAELIFNAAKFNHLSDAILSLEKTFVAKGWSGPDSTQLTFYQEYDSSKSYAINDCVFYSDALWRCISNGTTDVAPGTSSSRWTKIYPTSTTELTFYNAYNASKTYAVNDCLFYNGVLWRCIKSATGVAPGNTTYWTQIYPTSQTTCPADQVPVSSAIATLYGLGSGATIADVVTALGNERKTENLYTWRKNPNNITASLIYNSNTNVMIAAGESKSVTKTIYYYDTCTYDIPTAKWTLSGQHSVSLTFNGTSLPSMTAYRGKYLYYSESASPYNALGGTSGTRAFYIPTDNSGVCSYKYDSDLIMPYCYYLSCQLVDANQVITVSDSVVTSSSITAYPVDGTKSGSTYRFLGVPSQNMITGLRSASGTYTGNGAEVTLVLPFKPLFLWIQGPSSSTSLYNNTIWATIGVNSGALPKISEKSNSDSALISVTSSTSQTTIVIQNGSNSTYGKGPLFNGKTYKWLAIG